MLYFDDLSLAAVSPLKECAAFLQNHSMATMELGRYDVGDSGIYVNLMEYDTKAPEEGVYEAHRAYADLQVVVTGREAAYYGDVTAMKQGEYHAEGDYLLCEAVGAVERLLLTKGSGVVFMPEDGHMPGITADTPCHVRKAVFKIPVSLF